jgi:outer membrane protein OmpA-like peptidoglycan-associated protein
VTILRKQSRTLAFRRTALVIAIGLGISSCASVDQFVSSNSTTINCLAGGLLGAATGVAAAALTKGNEGAMVTGAVIGAAAGCGLALSYKSRLQKLQQLALEENLKLQVETLQTQGSTPRAAPKDAGIVAQVEDHGMFPTGSATLSVDGQRQVRKLASAFAAKPGEQASTAILVVGHTDATGSAEMNQKLSQRRARAVASILTEQGISAERMYFQGAGASRPLADNADPLLRGQNRRVEIVEVNDKDMLVKRINAEQNNPKYLAHGTATRAPRQPASPAMRSKASTPPAKTNLPTVAQAPASAPRASKSGSAMVDFGGQPALANNWTMGQAITPKSGGFRLVATAQAAEMPMGSCEADRPRQSGAVFSLATGEVLDTRSTTDYLPGYNNRVWANVVNGHLVTLSPVSILRDSASVDRQPFIEVVKGYEQGNRKSIKSAAVANTYEGESQVLYRVFSQDPKAPVSCIDVVFSKNNSEAKDGALFYPVNSNEAYTARFVPIRA